MRQVPGARSTGRLLAGEQGAATQVSGGCTPRRQRWALNLLFSILKNYNFETTFSTLLQFIKAKYYPAHLVLYCMLKT